MKRILCLFVIFLAILTLILGGCSVELARHKTADGINKAVSKTVEVSEYDKGSVFMWRSRPGRAMEAVPSGLHSRGER